MQLIQTLIILLLVHLIRRSSVGEGRDERKRSAEGRGESREVEGKEAGRTLLLGASCFARFIDECVGQRGVSRRERREEGAEKGEEKRRKACWS